MALALDPDSSDGLFIQTRKLQNPNPQVGLVFANPAHNKVLIMKESSCGDFGRPIMIQEPGILDLAIVLTTTGPNTLWFILVKLRKSTLIKSLKICVPKSNFNSRSLIKITQESRVFLFYHESKPEIEVRSLLSLKLLYTFNLAEICESLNITSSLPQIRSSIDFVEIPHLFGSVVILGPKIVFLSRVNRETCCEVLFDSAEHDLKDKFLSLDYSLKTKTVLLRGLSSYLLLEFDNIGVKNTKLMKFDRRMMISSRFIGWDPIEEIILIAQRTHENRENYKILDYQSSDVKPIMMLRDQPQMSVYHSSHFQRVFFVKTDFYRRKSMKALSLKNFRSIYPVEQSIDGGSIIDNIEIEEEHYGDIPEICQDYEIFFMRTFLGFLVVKPSNYSESYTAQEFSSDLALKF